MSSFRKFWNLRNLRKNVWLKTEELLKIQEKKLKMIVNHAYENVEYYHKKFNSLGLKPEDIKTVEDLQKLPTITKEEVRKNFPKRITAINIDLDKCKSYFTSGSTGLPLRVVVDPKGNDYRAALFGRPFFECGLGLRDKMMFVGDTRYFLHTSSYWFQKLGILRRKFFSSAEPVEDQLSSIVSYSPEAIFAYSSYLYLLAKEIQQKSLKQFSPRLVFSTAEILDTDERKFINTAFDTEIIDLYGCVETERLAWECKEHEGYHMDVDSNLIEFVKDNETVSSDEEGRIVITCLYNYAMPLIRYEIGDVGAPSGEQCSCGRGLPLMKRILGRKDDFIICPNGRIVYSFQIRHAIRSVPEIVQFKVVQQSKTKLTVYIVVDEKFSDKTIENLISRVRRVVGEDLKIIPSVVEKIEKEKSGKLRAVISHVKKP